MKPVVLALRHSPVSFPMGDEESLQSGMKQRILDSHSRKSIREIPVSGRNCYLTASQADEQNLTLKVREGRV
jgi:hypothetical protein